MVWFQPLLPHNSSDLRHDANLSCKPLLGPGWGVHSLQEMASELGS